MEYTPLLAIFPFQFLFPLTFVLQSWLLFVVSYRDYLRVSCPSNPRLFSSESPLVSSNSLRQILFRAQQIHIFIFFSISFSDCSNQSNYTSCIFSLAFHLYSNKLAALAQMVACLSLVQQVRGSIPGEVVNFNLKIFNLGARRGGDVCMLRRHIVLLIAIRSSDGDVKPGGPLGAFREEQAMSRHRVSPSPFLSSSSSHTTQ